MLKNVVVKLFYTFKFKYFLRACAPSLYMLIFKLKNNISLFNFKLKYKDVKVYPKILEGVEYYSQHNQDSIIYNTFFNGKENGVFIDVGANHPILINNTFFFEKKGWSGYAFDPILAHEKLWGEQRTAKLFNVAVSNDNKDIQFTAVSSKMRELEWVDMLSHVTESLNESHQYESNVITVKTIMLKDFFLEYNIKQVDYMSIDVEGHELNVLKGIDWDKCNISVLTIENNTGKYSLQGCDEIREFMNRNGYIYYARIWGLDDIFVRRGFLSTAD